MLYSVNTKRYSTLLMKPMKEHQMLLKVHVSSGTFKPFNGSIYSSCAVEYLTIK